MTPMKTALSKIAPIGTLLACSLAALSNTAVCSPVFRDLDEIAGLAEGATFVEENGVIAIEAEALPHDPTYWELDSSIDGYSGSGYLVGKIDSFNTGGLGVIRYPISVANSGVYQLNWKGRITIGDARGEHNDAFARIVDSNGAVLDASNSENEKVGNTQWYKVFMNRLDQWSYDSKNVDHVGISIAWELEAGKSYFFEISARSLGFGLDRIVLWNRSSQNFGNVETGRVSAEAPMDALAESKRSIEVDSDNDGLPDAFEERFADLSLRADLDEDGDGLLTGLEYVLGTDPTRPSAGFEVSEDVSDGDRVLRFAYSLSEDAAAYYQVLPEFSGDLSFWVGSETLSSGIEQTPTGQEGVSLAQIRVPADALEDALFMQLAVERITR